MQPIHSLSALSEQYDGFIVDLWGVIHDGLALYPGVIDCLSALKAANKHIVFLSNAPRRAAMAADKLTKMGITEAHYDGILTSGELTYYTLTTSPPAEAPGKHYRLIGPERDSDIMDGSDYTEVGSMQEADFILNLGFDDDDLVFEHYLPLLEEGIAHNKPMICANPDDYVVRISGEKFPCAGLLAEAYQERGGMVQYYGKPFPDIYASCLGMLGNIDRKRVLAVGDNLDTDIKGGNGAGIDTLLITGGVLKVELELREGEMPAPEVLQPLCEKAGGTPTYVMAQFAY